MTDDLIDDIANCEASPYNLAVDHFAIGMGNDILVRENIRDVSSYTLVDAYHALYSGRPELFENPDPVAASWWREFFRTGEAGKLRAKTAGNHRLTAEVCVGVARQLTSYIKTAPPDAGQEGESFEAMRRRIKAVRVAAEVADGEAKEAIAIEQSLNDGMGTNVDREIIEEAERRVKRSATLKKILDIAGAMTKFRKGAKRRKVDGFNRVSSITTSGDLTKLLPSEIMQFAGPPILAANTMRRLVENQTLAMKKFSYEKHGRGPIVVVVDESYSMTGEPFEQAKGLALAMARIAQEQKRWIALVGFATCRKFNELVMPPNQWDVVKLFDWLEHFYQGGTDFVVLQSIVNRWEKWGVPKGQADIIFCTDGEAELEGPLVKNFNEFKRKRDVKCYGMAIGESVCDLPLVCDKCWTTANIGLESTAVREVLTL